VAAEPTTVETTVPAPSLTRLDVAGEVRGLVLVLHGGKHRSDLEVDSRSASWRRCLSLQRAIAPRLHAAGVGCWQLRYRHRGWNGGTGPVEDARWALEQVRRDLGNVPVVLLGHSMGARTAVHVADDPLVLGVVGLAPWLPPDESVAALAGRHLVAAHGRRDRITSFRATAAYVERARPVAASAVLHDMGPVGHYLLRRVGAWNELASASALTMLDGAG
jgi:alpha-beta hydrolase superfamily lysophospholipase